MKAGFLKLKALLAITISCICLALIFVTVLYLVLKEQPSFDLPVDAEDIVWNEADGAAGDSVETPCLWNGLSVSKSLDSALKETDSKEYFAIYVTYIDDSERLDCFVYNGKSYKDYRNEEDSLWTLYYKFESFFKTVEYLREDGIFYVKDFPEFAVNQYGENFINQYVVDGVFLEEKALADKADIEEKLENMEAFFETVRQEYRLKRANEIYSEFKKEGYPVTVVGTTLYLFITKEELSEIKVSNPEKYYFAHALRTEYDSSKPLPD